jgi:subtilisin family serine protease
MYNAPYYLYVGAAGNDGNDDSANLSPLEGNSSYDKLTGDKVSKNGMVVANGLDAIINEDGTLNSVTINSSSSEGPTDDLRIKPDIMGNGTGLYSTYEGADDAYNSISGTSMASPNITGSLLLLQQYYNETFGNFMRASTLKGLALHTADDVGMVGPDALSGWGLMNTKKSSRNYHKERTTICYFRNRINTRKYVFNCCQI